MKNFSRIYQQLPGKIFGFFPPPVLFFLGVVFLFFLIYSLVSYLYYLFSRTMVLRLFALETFLRFCSIPRLFLLLTAPLPLPEWYLPLRHECIGVLTIELLQLLVLTLCSRCRGRKKGDSNHWKNAFIFSQRFATST